MIKASIFASIALATIACAQQPNLSQQKTDTDQIAEKVIAGFVTEYRDETMTASAYYIEVDGKKVVLQSRENGPNFDSKLAAILGSRAWITGAYDDTNHAQLLPAGLGDARWFWVDAVSQLNPVMPVEMSVVYGMVKLLSEQSQLYYIPMADGMKLFLDDQEQTPIARKIACYADKDLMVRVGGVADTSGMGGIAPDSAGYSQDFAVYDISLSDKTLNDPCSLAGFTPY